jgi:hypothetical protein
MYRWRPSRRLSSHGHDDPRQRQRKTESTSQVEPTERTEVLLDLVQPNLESKPGRQQDGDGDWRDPSLAGLTSSNRITPAYRRPPSMSPRILRKTASRVSTVSSPTLREPGLVSLMASVR